MASLKNVSLKYVLSLDFGAFLRCLVILYFSLVCFYSTPEKDEILCLQFPFVDENPMLVVRLSRK